MTSAARLVAFYRFWHGTLRLPGAGRLLRRAARRLPELQSFPLTVPGVGSVRVDFRDCSAYFWINTLLGEPHQEDGLIAFLKQHFSPDGVFWDVGANIGAVAASLFQSFPAASFCLFEPNPALAPRLSGLFEAQRNVLVLPQALSHQTGTAILAAPPGESPIARLHEHATAPGIEVPRTTGDRFASDHPHLGPTLVKIDVEGHEPSVLAGMKAVIARCRPVIAFEHMFLDDARIASLVPHGYRLAFIGDADGALSHTLDRSRSHNAALLPAGD